MQRPNLPTPSVAQDEQTMTSIVDELFLTHASREPDEATETGEIPMISEAELKLAGRLTQKQEGVWPGRHTGRSIEGCSAGLFAAVT